MFKLASFLKQCGDHVKLLNEKMIIIVLFITNKNRNIVTIKFMATSAPICQQYIMFLACPGVPFTPQKGKIPLHTPFGMLDTCSSKKLGI